MGAVTACARFTAGCTDPRFGKFPKQNYNKNEKKRKEYKNIGLTFSHTNTQNQNSRIKKVSVLFKYQKFTSTKIFGQKLK